MQQFLALIIPIGQDSGGGGSPPGIWGPTDPRPGWGLPPETGKPPSSPPGFWGGSSEPFPGYGLPGNQPGIWPGPGPLPHPEHPIHYPPGIWGGANQPFPTPPIVIPPTEPGKPPGLIWGGGNVPFPTPPIEIPGAGEPPTGGQPVKLVEWKTAWTPQTGWIVVGIPQVPVPTPA